MYLKKIEKEDPASFNIKTLPHNTIPRFEAMRKGYSRRKLDGSQNPPNLLPYPTQKTIRQAQHK
jgi:hypothetical protein